MCHITRQISVYRCRKNSHRDTHLHFVVTREMSVQEPLQVLEQMVVARSKIGTICGMVKHLPEELLQQLCTQRRMRTSVVVEQYNVSMIHSTSRVLTTICSSTNKILFDLILFWCYKVK
ncbi:hypothetical protein AVEN_266447-1 [Araneus ventricosus]|uniref:Uncharacterized protein n=1 Tax=Araneus ventricosus TaxID=182803 RepID=A0A4Y2G5G5_ARAVE|nr:hypothetical protein AVEN_266447-1 [Araneus ventricosus]